MNRCLAILLACILSASAYAQTDEGQIRMERSRFYNGDRVLKPGEVLDLMKSDPEAFGEFKKAKANYDAAQVFGFIGGFMVGWPLGTALGGGEPQWGLAAGGAAFILASLPFHSAFKKHATNAITIYNGQPTVRSFPTNIKVRFYGSGAAIVMQL